MSVVSEAQSAPYLFTNPNPNPNPVPDVGRPDIGRPDVGRPDIGRVVLIGNEKGGSGKSTTAIHVAVALLRAGASVATIDLDSRQATLTRYVENRKETSAREGVALPLPEHYRLEQTGSGDAVLHDLVAKLRARASFVVIDSPGADVKLARAAHILADTLLTPLNDSFIDLDLLARLDGEDLSILGPGPYAELVWEQRQHRAKQGLPALDWIVMRNRLGALGSRSGRRIDDILLTLAKRFDFRLAAGLSERVIFRELFPSGLTLLDLREAGGAKSFSQVAARMELRKLLETLALSPKDGWGAIALAS